MRAMSGAPLEGTVLQGRYRVDERVGEGGFGAVYRGHHLTLDVPVAIKVLRRVVELDPGSRERLTRVFADEAKILARLRHPNVVSVLDFGAQDEGDLGEVPWLVLEWCEGEELGALVERRGPLAVDDAWAIMRPVIAAVAHAHARGIVHRDLKPSNVMLVRDDDDAVSPRVLDFGIAKRVLGDAEAGSGSTRTGSGFMAFTPAYAAPEQLAGTRTGPWTDVHALGLVFTELLLGKPVAELATSVLGALDPDRRPTPKSFGLEVGPAEAALEKALSLRPSERFASASELLAALDAALGPPKPLSAEIAEGVTSSARRARAAAETLGATVKPIAPRPEAAPAAAESAPGASQQAGAGGTSASEASSPRASLESARTLPARGASADPSPTVTAQRPAGKGRALVVGLALAGLASVTLAWRLGRSSEPPLEPTASSPSKREGPPSASASSPGASAEGAASAAGASSAPRVVTVSPAPAPSGDPGDSGAEPSASKPREAAKGSGAPAPSHVRGGAPTPSASVASPSPPSTATASGAPAPSPQRPPGPGPAASAPTLY